MCCGRDLNIQPSTCDANALNQCATPRSIEGPGPLQGQMLAKQQRCIVCEGSGLLCRLLALAEATYRNQYPSSCVVGVTKNFCHIFLGNHTGQLPDIWHRASVWRNVSCNAVLKLRHVHFLFYATLNIVDIGKFAHKIISVTIFLGTTEASFLIFGTKYQCGELYRVTHFYTPRERS